MPGVAEIVTIVIDEMIYGNDFELINLFYPENVNLTHEDLNTGIDEPEQRLNKHHVSYDTSKSRAIPSSNGQLSYCS